MTEPIARSRDLLLAEVRERIAGFGRTRDAALLSGADAVAAASGLRAATDLDADQEARYALGVLHWLRHVVLAEEGGGPEFAAAADLLLPLARTAPELVPPHLRAALARGAASPSPDQPAAPAVPAAPAARTDAASAARARIAAHAASGDLAPLREAVGLFRAAARSARGTAQEAGAWSDLGAALQMVADATGDPSTLDEALAVCRRAVALTADGGDGIADSGGDARAGRLANLALALSAVGRGRAGTGLLREAVATARTALDLSRTDAARRRRLSGLGAALQDLYERTGTLRLLTEAVAATRGSVAPTADGPQDDPRLWANHAGALSALHTRTRSAAVLREAITAGRTALGLLPPSDRARAVPSGNLAVCLLARHERAADPEALDESVALLRAAVGFPGLDAPTRNALLSSLGLVLRARYEYRADPDVLAESVAVGRLAVAGPLAPAHTAAAAANLSLSLHLSYQITGDTALLQEAVARARQAAELTAAGHPDRMGRLSNLGIVLRSIGERTGDARLLAEGVAACREALAAARRRAPDRPAVRSTLSLLLRAYAAAADDLGALREAAAISRDVAAGTRAHDPDRPGRLSNLMIILRLLHARTGDPSAPAEAVAAGREAVGLLPAGHGHLPAVRANLGLSLAALGTLRGDARTAHEAEDLFAQAAQDTGASTVMRIWAHRERARLAAARAGHDAAMAAVEAAVALLPRLAGRRLERADREHALGRVSGLAAQAVAVAVAAGRPQRGVELLERARGLLLAEGMLERSADLARLRERAPGLADEFVRLQQEFLADAATDPVGAAEAGGGHQAAAAAAAHLAGRRAGLDERWQAMVAAVRALPGLRSFLDPVPLADLRGRSAEGPVVYVYAADEGCGALVVPADGGPPLPVRGAVPGVREAARQADALRAAVGEALTAGTYGGRLRAGREMNAVLEWLWDAVAEPVLDAVAGSGGGLPARLWWCPVGVMAHLPLHAAGRHRERAGRSVMDRVVSSYTPTLYALSYARRTPAPRTADPAGALVVCVPDPPGATPLPGAEGEAQALRGLLPGADVLSGPQAGYDAVVGALENRSMAHFACHAVADRDVPSESRVLLSDHLVTPLTIGRIARVSSPHGALCYLSACSTTQAAPRLADESVHITSAFQLIGFTHVIGTFWPVGDEGAVRIATRFYTGLKDAEGRLRVDRAAEVIVSAARSVRDVMPSAPVHWAGYLHAGA
ncbi:CHAT domain-containing tetratricopeptide repeat protein [Streptomyces sp. CA2R106]|uniref:CHAT domain-containing tetratricopeptide repeat protein n=1 Tax=Streptomyces sp. CA2R106 TaxID=3120153 RepID=UPI003009D8E6